MMKKNLSVPFLSQALYLKPLSDNKKGVKMKIVWAGIFQFRISYSHYHYEEFEF